MEGSGTQDVRVRQLPPKEALLLDDHPGAVGEIVGLGGSGKSGEVQGNAPDLHLPGVRPYQLHILLLLA